ncbi:MAG: VWA domain-containing protein [Vicinamibacteria bacterium]
MSTHARVAASVLLWALSSPARAQQPPSFEATRELVRVDVVALDQEGRPVRGLTADDFEIHEKGRLLPITSFEAVVVTGASPKTSPPGISAPAPADPESNRAFVVLFDDENISLRSAYRVQTDLAKFLASGLGEGDLVSLVTTSRGLRYTARTAEERRRLAALLSGLRGTKDIDYRVTTDGLTEGAGKTEAGAGLAAVARALLALEGFRGRKSLIVYSEGYAKTEDAGQSMFDQVVELARRTRVSIFFADVHPEGGDGSPASGRIPGQTEGRRSSLREETSGTAYLADSTGGRSANTVDKTVLFREAVEQASAYYLIGFDPPEGKDGERKLQVRSRRGLTLRAPDRYFVGGSTPPATDAASALRGAMASMFDSGGVPFTVSTSSRPGVSSTTFSISLARADGAPPRKLDLRIEARPLAKGEPVRDASELTVPRGEGPARLQRDLPLRPGAWQARVAVRDRDTGQIGSVLHTFDVEDGAALAP